MDGIPASSSPRCASFGPERRRSLLPVLFLFLVVVLVLVLILVVVFFFLVVVILVVVFLRGLESRAARG